MLQHVSENKENLQNHANTLIQNYQNSESAKYGMMKLIKDKEKLSMCLSDRLAQLEALRKENVKLRMNLDGCKKESEELISCGLSYLDSARE